MIRRRVKHPNQIVIPQLRNSRRLEACHRGFCRTVMMRAAMGMGMVTVRVNQIAVRVGFSTCRHWRWGMFFFAIALVRSLC